MDYILIFWAGGLGSLLRYVIGLALPLSFFPWATVGINVIGSFAIGFLGGSGSRMGWSDNLQLALTVGLCGGFTTFSTFSKEALSLATAGRWGGFQPVCHWKYRSWTCCNSSRIYVFERMKEWII